MSISKYLKGFLAESASKRDEVEIEEKELTSAQKEIDTDKDGKIDGDDLADLRAKKKKIEEEIAKYDPKTKTTKNVETDLEDATDEDEPTGKSDEIEDEEESIDEEEESDEDEEEIDEEISEYDDETKTTKNRKTALELQTEEDEEDDEDEEEIDEEISEYDDETKTTKNRKTELELQTEATIVLPSDTALVALNALSKKANTMLVSKVKAELEKKGLVSGGKITETGKDLVNSPDAEDRMKEIGS